VLANLKPTGETNIPDSLFQLASMIKGKSLVMLCSDLLPTTDDWKAETDALIRSLYRLRYSGHESHRLPRCLRRFGSEVPADGSGRISRTWSRRSTRRSTRRAIRDDYVAFVEEFRILHQGRNATSANVDYVGMDTSVGFDKALLGIPRSAPAPLRVSS